MCVGLCLLSGSLWSIFAKLPCFPPWPLFSSVGCSVVAGSHKKKTLKMAFVLHIWSPVCAYLNEWKRPKISGVVPSYTGRTQEANISPFAPNKSWKGLQVRRFSRESLNPQCCQVKCKGSCFLHSETRCSFSLK